MLTLGKSFQHMAKQDVQEQRASLLASQNWTYNPPSFDHFSRHGAQNFEAADLICQKVSLDQKNWSPNGNQAKTLTWRVEIGGQNATLQAEVSLLHGL